VCACVRACEKASVRERVCEEQRGRGVCETERQRGREVVTHSLVSLCLSLSLSVSLSVSLSHAHLISLCLSVTHSLVSLCLSVSVCYIYIFGILLSEGSWISFDFFCAYFFADPNSMQALLEDKKRWRVNRDFLRATAMSHMLP